MPVSRRRKKNGKKTFKRKPKASGSASSSQSHQNIRDLQELSNYLDVEEARFRAGEGITGHDLSDSRIRRGMPAQKRRVEAYHDQEEDISKEPEPVKIKHSYPGPEVPVGTKIPLVDYSSGERVVIGESTIISNDNGEVFVESTIPFEDAPSLFKADYRSMSVGPFSAPSIKTKE